MPRISCVVDGTWYIIHKHGHGGTFIHLQILIHVVVYILIHITIHIHVLINLHTLIVFRTYIIYLYYILINSLVLSHVTHILTPVYLFLFMLLFIL